MMVHLKKKVNETYEIQKIITNKLFVKLPFKYPIFLHKYAYETHFLIIKINKIFKIRRLTYEN